MRSAANIETKEDIAMLETLYPGIKPIVEEVVKTPQHIVDSIKHRKNKKAKARARRKLAKYSSGKNNWRHKQPGYKGRRNYHSCRSWR